MGKKIDPKHSMWIGRIMYVRRWGRDDADTRQEVMHQRAILFLTIIDMIRTGLLDENKIHNNLLFESKYLQTWRKYKSVWCFRDNLLYPLVQLNEEDFYSLVPVSGDFADIVNNKKDWNIGDWATYVKYGKLDDELFDLLNDPSFADALSEALAANLVVKKEAGKNSVTKPAAKPSISKPDAKPSISKPAAKTPVAMPTAKTPTTKPAVKTPIAKPTAKPSISKPTAKTPVAMPATIEPALTPRTARGIVPPHQRGESVGMVAHNPSESVSDEVCRRRQPRRIEEAKEGHTTWAKATMCSLWIEEILEMECELRGCLVDPNKPILILAVLELIGRKKIHMNRIFFDTLLGDTFAALWEWYVPQEWNFAMDVAKGYTGLQSEIYYNLVPDSPRDAALVVSKKDWNPASVMSLVAYSEFDEDLFSIMKVPRFAADIKEAIVDKFINQQAAQYNNLQNKESLESEEKPGSEDATGCNEIPWREETIVNTDHSFKNYLGTLRRYDGKPFSPNRIDIIIRTLHGIEMQRLLNKHLNGMKIEDVERTADIDMLISYARPGIVRGMLDEDVLTALRFYREFLLQER